MKIWNRDACTLKPLVTVFLTLVVVVSGNGHAQSESAVSELSSAYRVYDAENLDWLTKIKWGLQWMFVPTALNDIVPFYSYNLRDICQPVTEQAGSDENLANSGSVDETAGWGAILYRDVDAAFENVVEPFATSHNVECSPVRDLLPLNHAAIIGNWHSITAIQQGSDKSINEAQDLFLATTYPLSIGALPDASPRMFVGENYAIGSFLGNR